MHYFLIPGNPPAVHFYELWKQEIIAHNPQAKVRVSPYPTLKHTTDSKLAMHEVLLAHQKELLAFHHEVQAPVTVIGHSLGGNFALRLLEQSDLYIEKVILLHPFLRQPKKHGRLILKTVAAFYQKTHWQKFVIKNRRWLEYLSDELPHVTDDEMEKSFHLAHHESVIISPDDSPIILKQEHRHKVSAFYHANDTWCPPQVVSELKLQVKAFECHEPHGFITIQKHRKSLFNSILAKI